MTDEEPVPDRLELEPDLPPGVEPEDGDLKSRSIRYTPAQQGLEIPAGWKPTAAQPVPVVRCHYVRPDTHPRLPGERCNKWSLRGSRLCYFHSGRGNLRHVEEYRQAVIEASRLMLVDAAPDAVKTMLDLMANSGADNVRLKAAESVLDRTGIRGGAEIDVTVTDVSGQDPAQTLAERLSKLKVAADKLADTTRKKQEEDTRLALEAGSPPVSVLRTESEIIIDAEVVTDETEASEAPEVENLESSTD